MGRVKITSLTSIQFLREINRQEARQLLESGNYQTTAEVSYAVGFTNTHHFSKLYAERFGKKPSEY